MATPSSKAKLRSRLRPPVVAVEPEKRPKPRTLTKALKVLRKELDPRLIGKWPWEFRQSIVHAASSLFSARHAKFNDFISGLVESCLLFTFASVFASSIFSEVGVEYVALGTGCTLVTTTIIQSSFSLFSDCGLTIGGPEITPTIFLTSMANIAKKKMQSTAAAGAVGRRRLSESTPAPGTAVIDSQDLLTTVLAIIIISSVVFGAFVYVLGRFKISKVIRLIPACVLSGYMASIGYLVFVKAMSTSMPHEVYDQGPGQAMFWAYFMPALSIGIIMYLQRRWKVGNPTVVLPILLFTPIILFYICVYGSGSNIVQASVDGWLFPAFADGMFYNQLIYSYGRADRVDWSAVSEAVPTMITMFFVVTLEAIMKQASTKKLLKAFDMRVDHELMLIGKANICTGLMAGVIGYPQPKLTYINYSIVRNTTTRVPGLIVTAIAAIIFFSGFPLINYLPRFWLSGVLIFAASGFLVENLYDGFFTYTHKEYLVIAAIVIINATVSMAWAVVAGIIMSAMIFALSYSRQDLIKSVISGGEWRSNILRPIKTETKLEHLGQRALIIQLHRFVFFGNASYLNEVVSGLLKAQQGMPQHLRALFLVFDWSRVENVDITASTVIYEMVHKVGSGNERTVLFTGLDQKMRRKLAESVKQIHAEGFKYEQPDFGPNQRVFATLDLAMEFVEDALLLRSEEMRKRWFAYSSLEDFCVRAQYKNAYEFWEQLDYFQTFVQVPKAWSLCRMGEKDDSLYVLKEGSLSLLGGNVCVQRLKPGAFVNENALCGQLPMHTVVADVDSIVVQLSSKEQHNLQLTNPAAAFELHKMIEDHLLRVKRKNTARLDVMNLWQDKDNQTKPSGEGQEELAEGEQEEEEEEPVAPKQEGEEVVESSPAFTAMSRLRKQMSFVLGGVATTPEQVVPISEGVQDLEAQSSSPHASALSPPAANAVEGEAEQPATDSTISRLRKQLSFVTSGSPTLTATLLPAGVVGSDLEELPQIRKPLVSFDGDEAADFLLETVQHQENVAVEEDVFDQLRDDAGEEEGMRLARRFIRRQSSVAMPSSPVTALKLLQSDLVVAAISRRLALLPPARLAHDRRAPKGQVYYHLCPTFAAHARVVFGTKAVRRAGETELLELPRTRLKETLNAIGVCYHGEDVGRIPHGQGLTLFDEVISPDVVTDRPDDTTASEEVFVSLVEFLDLVVELTTHDLPRETEELLFAFCRHQPRITEQELVSLLPYTSPLMVAKFVNLWDEDRTRTVDLDSLCSALSQFQTDGKINAQVQADWIEMSQGEEGIQALQLAALLGIDLPLAKEMIWEADCTGEETITLNELLATLSL